jgi:hypothetical protein
MLQMLLVLVLVLLRGSKRNINRLCRVYRILPSYTATSMLSIARNKHNKQETLGNADKMLSIF